MKNKKGFTLLELLAVIVILAVIALIAMPVILNIIETSKKNAAIRSAEGYFDAIEKSNMNSYMKDEEPIYGSNLDVKKELSVVKVKGTSPTSGKVTVDEKGVSYANLCISNYNVTYSGTNFTVDDECEDPSGITKVTDSNPGVIFGDGTVEDYNEQIGRIRCVEDLIALSKIIKAPAADQLKNKTIILEKTLDLQNDKSYIDKTKKADVLKDGIEPIGDSTYSFYGTFEGNAQKIINLKIAKQDQNYVGFFGNNNGIIRGITLEKVDISGKDRVGGLVGNNNGKIYESKVTGNVTGNNMVGGVVGDNNSYLYGSLANVNVTGNNSVGGLVGTRTSGSIQGIVEGGTIKSNLTRIGKIVGNGTLTSGSAAYEGVILNLPPGVSQYSVQGDGTNLDSEMLKDISYYDKVLDTYIGGDEESNTYYFDYDINNEIVIKKNDDLKIELEGSGTESSPYLIKTEEDMKYVSLYPTQSNYYKLMNDLDFSNKHFYKIGTQTKPFQGHFDGNMKTISNVKLSGYDYVGMFGKVQGGIEGLNVKNLKVKGISDYSGFIGQLASSIVQGITLENVDISGNNYVGGLVGHKIGSVYESKVTGNVTGNNYVGGAVGDNSNYLSTLANVNVTGNNYVGGLVGTRTSGSIQGIVEGGTIKSNLTRIGKIVGNGTLTSGSAAYEGVILNLPPGVSQYSVQGNGTNLDSEMLKDISYYDKVLDTYIGGDENSNKYYFDYDNNEIVIKKSDDLKIELEGSGTKSSPYLIKNEEDMKYVSLYPAQSNYYKLMNDLDFNNKHFYMIGTQTHGFQGYFDGNMKTISNVKLSGYDYVGMFGRVNSSSSVIEGLKVRSLKIKGKYESIGFVGFNIGIIKGVTLENIDITGNDYVGGLIGRNSGNGTIYEAKVSGKVTGNNYVGGVIGQNLNLNNYSTISNVNVTGNNTVGGLVGQKQNYGTIKGIVEGGTITGNTANTGKLSGNGSVAAVSAAHESVILNIPSGISQATGAYNGVSFGNDKFKNIEYYKTIIDAERDSDNSGYYFDNNDLGNDIIIKKVG